MLLCDQPKQAFRNTKFRWVCSELILSMKATKSFAERRVVAQVQVFYLISQGCSRSGGDIWSVMSHTCQAAEISGCASSSAPNAEPPFWSLTANCWSSTLAGGFHSDPQIWSHHVHLSIRTRLNIHNVALSPHFTSRLLPFCSLQPPPS